MIEQKGTRKKWRNGKRLIDMELIRFDRLMGVLEEYAKQAQEIYRYQVSLGGHNASRKLMETATCQVEFDGRGYEVSMNLQPYWKYLEGGSQGTKDSPHGAIYPPHFPPPWAIEKWINVKPILPRPTSTGRIPSPKQLSYAIANAIEQHGTEPYPALQTTIDELNEMYKDKFAIALGEDVSDYIVKVLVGLGDAKISQSL